MSPLATFDGVENGADIAVIQGSSRSKWKLVDGEMVDEHGDPLDPWFFAGLLAEGHVHLADFTPPEIGEWFTSHRSETRCWLTVSTETDGVVWTAMFTRGVFDGLHQVTRIVDQGTRSGPEWATPQVTTVLRTMGTQMLSQLTQLQQAATARREMRGFINDLNVVKSYVDSMASRTERMREL